MKILSPGKHQAWWIDYKAMCHKCKLVLQLEAGDEVVASSDTITEAKFICPACHAVVIIEPGKNLK